MGRISLNLAMLKWIITYPVLEIQIHQSPLQNLNFKILFLFAVSSPDSPLVSESSNTSSNSSGVASMSSHEEDKKSQEVLEIYQNVVRRPSSEAGSSACGGGGLEESTTDTQKAIIEQMCHVVWRVLEKKQKWNMYQNLIKKT